MHPVMQLYQTKLKLLFPPVRLGFAYGSAVFTQLGRSKVPTKHEAMCWVLIGELISPGIEALSYVHTMCDT